MYVCSYLCMYVCVNACMCVYVCVCVIQQLELMYGVAKALSAAARGNIAVCMYVHTGVCMYVCVNACMCVCDLEAWIDV